MRISLISFLILSVTLNTAHSQVVSQDHSIDFYDYRRHAINLLDTGFSEANELITQGSLQDDSNELLLGYFKLAIYYDLKNNNQALAYYDSANHLALTQKNYLVLSAVYLQLGFYYKNIINSEDSSQINFSRSLDYALQNEFIKGIVKASTGLAYLKMDRGDYVSAMDIFISMESLTDSLNYHIGKSSILANIGHIYMRLGLTQNALSYFKKSYLAALKEKDPDYPHMYYCLMLQAEANITLNRVEATDSVLLAAEGILHQNPDIKAEGYFIHQMWGVVHLRKEQYNLAIERFRKAYNPNKIYIMDRVASYVGQSTAFLYLGDTIRSHKLLLETKQLIEDHGPLPVGESLDFFRLMANSYGFFEEKERESHFLKKYIEAKETLNKELRVGQFLTRELEKKSQLEKQQASLEKQLLAQQLTNEKQRNYLLITLFILLLGVVAFLIYRSTRRKKYLDELTKLNSQLNATVGELTNVQEQLVQEKKMSAIGSLASGLAHEINNPLNYIQGSLTMLEKIYGELDCEKKDEVFTFLKHSKHGVKQINAVINNIDAFSIDEPRKLRTITLIPVVHAALELLKYQIPEYVDVTVHPTADIKSVEGDEVKLIQIFTSVILNSIEAINRKRSLINNKEFIDVSFSASSGPEHVEIKIANSGEKLQVKDLRKPFDPFYTEKNPGEGMGLGLSAAYFNVKFHKGSIEMSNNEQGVETTIILPVHSS